MTAYLRRIIGAVIALAILVIVAPAELVAQATTQGKAWCAECPDCPFNKHALVSEGDDEVIGQSHDCTTPGSCEGVHSPCSAFAALDTPAKLEIYLARVQQASRDALVPLVSELGDYAVLNVGRGALQIFGCSGQVVAHLPLDEAKATLLAGHVRIIET
jgi:hypothetical protein